MTTSPRRTPASAALRPLDASEMAAWHALLRSHAKLVRRLEADLEAEHQLSLPAYEVLAHLSDADGGRLRMSDLAACAVLTPSGLTRLVDKLSQEGLVQRQRCGADARVVYAVITEDGVGRLADAYPTHLRGVRRHFIDQLSPSQLHAVSDALGPLTLGCPSETSKS